MLDHSVFDLHLLYALATLGALVLLCGAWGLMASAQGGPAALLPSDRARDAQALAQSVQAYAQALEALEAPPAEPEALEFTLAQQLQRIQSLQRQVLPEFSERASQLQAAHGRLMDFLWHERLLCIREDRHMRRDPAVFDTLSQAVSAPLHDLAQGCANLAHDQPGVVRAAAPA